MLDALIVLCLMAAVFGTIGFFYLIVGWFQINPNALENKKKYVLWLIVFILAEAVCLTTVFYILTSGYLN
jgi:hypothetical protein